MTVPMRGTAGTTPNPDPTVATHDAVARAVDAERDYVDAQLDVLRERLRGIDLATVVLNDIVTRVPTDVQKAVSHLSSLTGVRFESVQTQFVERDKAIDKQERSTLDTINKLAELFKSTTDALADKVDDFRAVTVARMSALELLVQGLIANQAGGKESMTDRRQANGAVIALVGISVTLILAILTVITFAGRNV